ncbi:MAG: DUF86 domain-containing protein [Desulfobacterota bacterium]|jgi:uncharacterized protein YutE (UPF0331/DUF86 family)|nr:DUF86 domain-containing protein [Thermodesulfobacteriota bacterium]
MVDHKLIERKIRKMEEYLRELKKVPIKSLEEFTGNTVVKRFVERNIELAIEQMMAICKHLVAGLDLDEPETYAECFDILHQNKILPAKPLLTFKAMARYRNRLIHVYDDFDDAVTFDVYTTHLKDFSAFARIIRSFINKTLLVNKKKK